MPMVALIQIADADNVRLRYGNGFVRGVVARLAQTLLGRSGPTCKLFVYNDTSLLMAPDLTDPVEREGWVRSTTAELSRAIEIDGVTYSPHLAVSLVEEANVISGQALIARIETTLRHRMPERIGTTTITRYDSTFEQEIHARLAMADLLRGALERGELRLVYQPIVDAFDETVSGYEALMRWHNPTLGEVSPAVFIPVAEETGLIAEMTEWLIRTAWHTMNDPATGLQGNFSINISPVHMEQTDFLSGFTTLLETSAIDPHRIKIDRSFVMNLYSEDGKLDSRAATIVETMVFMAKALGIGILAEGIESQQEAALLREYGCESFQGYLFGRPAEVVS
jgi:EAL domain-containing protein (putative c-di-GMP-specific phosphodiesterase class I)